MCGLIGAAIKSNAGFTHSERTALSELLYMDALRGMDSTGVCVVRNDASVQVVKKATWAPAFMVSKAYSDLEETLIKTGKFFLGHNRKATVGDVTSKNAHPFVVDNEFVLMHNGSLTSHKHLGDADVDSAAIAQYLYDNWDDDANDDEKAKTLAHIGGAYALVWYDLRTEKLNIVRNSQRPLFYATGGWGCVFWASDENMLKCALERNSLKSYTIKSLPVHTLLTHDGVELKEVALPAAPFSPKKTTYVYSPTITSVSVGKKNTTVCNSATMSKNQFKKFFNTILDKEIIFPVDDFVDIDGKNSWYGEKPEWQFTHELVGYCSDELMFEVMNNYSLAKGVVKGAYYNKDDRSVKIHVAITGASKNETKICH